MDDPKQLSASPPAKNIVLVGRSGNGKTATGNSIVGKEAFISETIECQICSAKTANGMTINVIDTPGLFDLSVSTDYVNKEIINCLKLVEGGIHLVVLVLSAGNQISQEEESTLSTLQLLFGSQIVDFLVVLFTGGDVLEKENKTLDEYLSRDCPEFLKTVLRLCGGRRILFNNMTTDDLKKAEQVEQLLAFVKAIELSNDGKAYAEDMHHKINTQGEMLIEQQEEVESKNRAETEVEELKKQLEISYSQNMNKMAKFVEDRLKDSAASQEKMILALRDNLMNTHQEKKHSGIKCNIL